MKELGEDKKFAIKKTILIYFVAYILIEGIYFKNKIKNGLFDIISFLYYTFHKFIY